MPCRWLLNVMLELMSIFKFISLRFAFFLVPVEWLWMLKWGNLWLDWSLNLHYSLSLISFIDMLVGLVEILGSLQWDFIESILLKFVNNVISWFPIVDGWGNRLSSCMCSTKWMSKSILFWVKLIILLICRLLLNHCCLIVCCFLLCLL